MDSKKKIVWVTRSFLDYRVPVFAELDKLCDGKLTVIYNGDYVPERVQCKLRDVLGDRAVALHGEKRIGPNVFGNHGANRAVRIPWQPGLLREMKKCQPDVLISDGFFQWTAASLWMRARYKIPHLMCYERTAHTERHAQWYRKLYRKMVLRYIDAICCSGKLCGEYTKSLGVDKDKISYGHMVADVDGIRSTYEGVDGSAVQAIRDDNDLKGVVFLCVGRVVRMKGIFELLKAWHKFSVESEDATLVIVGDGQGRERAEEFCNNHKLTSVKFIGALDYDRLPYFYAASDCLVMPTLEDNWSLVVPEAMACGLPILCSKYNGCWPELVQNGANGWVFDPLNKKEFASSLSKVFIEEGELKNMGIRSQKIVAEYTPQTAAKYIFSACALVEI